MGVTGGFQASRTVPDEMPDERMHRITLARAIRALQEVARKHPTNVEAVSSDYTMTDLDSLILANAASAQVTVTLLTAAGREGRVVRVKKTDSSANLVVIDPAGTETIDGVATVSLTQQNAMRGMQSDGANWRLIEAIGNATAL